MLAAWNSLTEKYHGSLAQLVIAWTAAQPGVTHVLCGAPTTQQTLETAEAGDMQLAPDDMSRMRIAAEGLGEPG